MLGKYTKNRIILSYFLILVLIFPLFTTFLDIFRTETSNAITSTAQTQTPLQLNVPGNVPTKLNGPSGSDESKKIGSGESAGNNDGPESQNTVKANTGSAELNTSVNGNNKPSSHTNLIAKGGTSQGSDTNHTSEQTPSTPLTLLPKDTILSKSSNGTSLPPTQTTNLNTENGTFPLSVPNSNSNAEKDDKFGIKMIYPSKSGGEEWFFNANDPTSDGRFDPQQPITKNSDGSWKMRGGHVRMNVAPSTGFAESKIATTAEGVLEQKGFMEGPNDWKNLELTGYFKLNTNGKDDGYTIYARGGRHTGSGPPVGCEGTAYKADLLFNGESQIMKEQYHVDYTKLQKIPGVGPVQGKWVGFKVVIYNFVNHDNKAGVKVESYVDYDNNNHWKSLQNFTDTGGWGRDGQDCKGNPDQILSWGGPQATFRWDTPKDVDFKNLSVREISAGNITTTLPILTSTPILPVVPTTANNTNRTSNVNNSRIFPVINASGANTTTTSITSTRVPITPPVNTITGGNVSSVIRPNSTQILSTPLKSRSLHPQVAVSDNATVYTVWENDTGPNLAGDVFFKKSVDGGVTFTDPINLSNNTDDSTDPQLTVSGNNVYIAWKETPLNQTNPISSIHFRSSSNTGNNFGHIINLSQDLNSSSSNVRLSSNGTRVDAIWRVDNYYKTAVFNATIVDSSKTGGKANVTTLQTNTKNLLSGNRSQIGIGQRPAIVLREGTISNFTNDVVFGPIMLISQNATNPSDPQISSSRGKPHVLYLDQDDDEEEEKHKIIYRPPNPNPQPPPVCPLTLGTIGGVDLGPVYRLPGSNQSSSSTNCPIPSPSPIPQPPPPPPICTPLPGNPGGLDRGPVNRLPGSNQSCPIPMPTPTPIPPPSPPTICTPLPGNPGGLDRGPVNRVPSTNMQQPSMNCPIPPPNPGPIGPIINLTKIAFPTLHPRLLAVNNSKVYMVWNAQYPSDKIPGIYFSGNINGSSIFSTPVNIAANDFGGAGSPTIARTQTGTIFVAYDHNLPGYNSIPLFASIDNGKHFIKRAELNYNMSQLGFQPQITVIGNNVYVVYVNQDPRTGSISNLIVRHSTDGGYKFSKPATLSTTPVMIVSAGKDQTVMAGQKYTIRGSVSGPHVDQYIYSWSSGDRAGVSSPRGTATTQFATLAPSSSIHNTTGITPTLTPSSDSLVTTGVAPTVKTDTAIPFTFVATAPDFAYKKSDSMVLHVKAASAPTAVAQASPNPAAPGQTISLDAGKSHNSDGSTSGLAYSWKGPGFSSSGKTTKFTIPSTTTATSFKFDLTVKDTLGATATDSVTVKVNSVVITAIAEASPNPAAPGQTITLDASKSHDSNGYTLTYSWKGPGFSSSSKTTTFTIPATTTASSFTFDLTVKGDQGATASDSVTVKIVPVNHSPTADSKHVTTDQDKSITFDITGSDPDKDPLTFSIVSGPSHGSAKINSQHKFPPSSASVTYTPSALFADTDSFTFRVDDGHGGTDTATVTITVIKVNHAPIAKDGSATTDENTCKTITLEATDPDGDPLTYSVSQPSHGTLTQSGNGNTVEYCPDEDYTGPDSFTFKANDGKLDSNTATVSITVNAPLNQAPTADDQVITGQNPMTITLTGSDPDKDPLTFSIVSGPSHGSLSDLTQKPPNQATVDYECNAGDDCHDDSFEFQVDDGRGGTDKGSVTICFDGSLPACQANINVASLPINENSTGNATATNNTMSNNNTITAFSSLTGNNTSNDNGTNRWLNSTTNSTVGSSKGQDGIISSVLSNITKIQDKINGLRANLTDALSKTDVIWSGYNGSDIITEIHKNEDHITQLKANLSTAISKQVVKSMPNANTDTVNSKVHEIVDNIFAKENNTNDQSTTHQTSNSASSSKKLDNSNANGNDISSQVKKIVDNIVTKASSNDQSPTHQPSNSVSTNKKPDSSNANNNNSNENSQAAKDKAQAAKDKAQSGAQDKINQLKEKISNLKNKCSSQDKPSNSDPSQKDNSSNCLNSLKSLKEKLSKIT